MVMLKNREWNGQAAPAWATAVAKWRGIWYWEESIKQKLGDRFCRCGVDFEEYTRTYSEGTVTGCDVAYLLPPLETEDDPLPPVPESVLYREEDSPVGTDAELLVKGSKYGGLLLELRARRESDGKFACAGMRLDPDAALQLAHDLRRMAMDIKRKQKEVD